MTAADTATHTLSFLRAPRAGRRLFKVYNSMILFVSLTKLIKCPASTCRAVFNCTKQRKTCCKYLQGSSRSFVDQFSVTSSRCLTLKHHAAHAIVGGQGDGRPDLSQTESANGRLLSFLEPDWAFLQRDIQCPIWGCLGSYKLASFRAAGIANSCKLFPRRSATSVAFCIWRKPSKTAYTLLIALSEPSDFVKHL